MTRISVSRMTRCRHFSLHAGRHWVGYPVLHVHVTGGTP